jgi:predicted DNA-binding transcriptional regulator AlpA
MNTGTPNLIRLPEAIKRYNLSRTTFDKATNEGLIRKYKLARAVFVDTREIDAWIIGKTDSAN